MLFIVICLLIDILAIVLFMRDALKPATFLTMNCFQTGFFGGVLIMDLVAVMRGTSAAGIGFSVFVLYVHVTYFMRLSADMLQPFVPQPPHLLSCWLPPRKKASTPRPLCCSTQPSHIQPCCSYRLPAAVPDSFAVSTDCIPWADRCACRASA